MQLELVQVIENVVKDLFNIETKVVLTRPDEQFGDYATNLEIGRAHV